MAKKGPTDPFGFYALDVGYVDYLRTTPKGDQHVPVLIYEERNKFFCGPVMVVDDVGYFAPVSSKKHKNEAVFKIEDRVHQSWIGSVCYNYMIPVPHHLYKKLDIAHIEDAKYQNFVNIQEQYCRAHEKAIKQGAADWYDKRLCGQTATREGIPINDFDLLDEAAQDYVDQFGLITTQERYKFDDQTMRRLERNYLQVSGNDPQLTFDKFLTIYAAYTINNQTAQDSVENLAATHGPKLKQFKVDVGKVPEPCTTQQPN